jgi:hypothetical protein
LRGVVCGLCLVNRLGVNRFATLPVFEELEVLYLTRQETVNRYSVLRVLNLQRCDGSPCSHSGIQPNDDGWVLTEGVPEQRGVVRGQVFVDDRCRVVQMCLDATRWIDD